MREFVSEFRRGCLAGIWDGAGDELGGFAGGEGNARRGLAGKEMVFV